MDDNYDFLLHVGDLSYAEAEGLYWDRFNHLIEPIATKLPYMISVGNHEYDHYRYSSNTSDVSGVSG